MGNYNVTFAPDQSYISNLQNKTYMGAVSPWFFTVRLPSLPSRTSSFAAD